MIPNSNARQVVVQACGMTVDTVELSAHAKLRLLYLFSNLCGFDFIKWHEGEVMLQTARRKEDVLDSLRHVTARV